MTSKLPTVVSLVILVVATCFEWYWVWGVLYLFWAVQSMGAGEAFLVQTVRRDGNPVMFWSVSAMWFILAVLVIVTDLFSGVDAWLGAGG